MSITPASPPSDPGVIAPVPAEPRKRNVRQFDVRLAPCIYTA